MARYRNSVTRVVVNVDEDTASQLNKDWKPFDGSKPKSDNPDASWKVAELKDYADENGIDLGEATKKEDLLAAIAAASVSE